MDANPLMIDADLDSVKRMLGCDEVGIPPAVVTEYRIRLRMFHSNGHSGPLGTIGLIDLLRSFKLGPKPLPLPPRCVDWSRMPRNGSLRVEAHVLLLNGVDEWRSGVFLGKVGVGGLAVRLDGDTYVHEFSGKDVRLPVPGMEVESPAESAAPPKEKKKEKPQPSWLRKKNGQPLASSPPPPPPPPPTPPPPPPPPPHPAAALDNAHEGDVVWVKVDGDIRDGVFRGRTADGILVLVEGEPAPRTFAASQIRHAPTDPDPESESQAKEFSPC